MPETTIQDQLDALFAPWNRMDAPGMTVGVVKDGQALYRRGFGMASLESRVANGPATRIRIGSTSKHFTAMLALLLQEDGKFDLDAPMRTWLPELTGPAGEPSARLYLQHRGGTRCYLDVGLVGRGMAAAAAGESLAVQARQTDRNFAPGTAMIYNNGGYHLLSIAIERVGGAPFEEQLEARILDVIGMNETLALPSDLIIVPGMATLHEPRPEGGWRRGLFPSGEVRGEGSIVSTIDDMLKWTAHLRTRDKLGSAETWRQLTELPVYADGSKGIYALGLMIHPYRGLPTIHHAGGVFGGLSQMLTFPRHGLDVIILANGGPGANPVRLAEQVADIVLADQLGPETPKVGIEGREALIGDWWSDETGLVFNFTEAEGELKFALCAYPVALTADANGGLLTPAGSLGSTWFETAEGSLAAHFGGLDATYLKVERHDAPDAAFARAVEGRYASAESGSTVEIQREGDKLIARFGDPFGRAETELVQLGDRVAVPKEPKPDLYHASALSFDRVDGPATSFRLNTARTRGLVFRRV
jgi:D-aminopeptidase